MPQRRRLRVYLVPGFVGFANLGEIRYFGHIRHALVTAMRDAGVDGSVHVVHTHPTASLRLRVRRLHTTIARTARGRDEVHVIGHSTGGLDARLLLSPGIDLGGGAAVEPVARRVRTVVTVSTPHRGTPIASFFASVLGGRLLRVLSPLACDTDRS